MGAMFDWRREAVSADPEYYKWTQWFFIQLYKHGLAYRKMSPVDFCPHCNTTLAREQVWGEDRHCERCGTPVIKKDLDQWFFRITKYADELLNYDGMDWPERVRSCRPTGSAVPKVPRSFSKLEAGRSRSGSLHHPPRYAVGCHLHGALPGASAGGESSPRPIIRRQSKPTRNRLPANRISSARRSTRKRPVSSPAAMPSTRSIGERSPSGSPIMS